MHDAELLAVDKIQGIVHRLRADERADVLMDVEAVLEKLAANAFFESQRIGLRTAISAVRRMGEEV